MGYNQYFFLYCFTDLGLEEIVQILNNSDLNFNIGKSRTLSDLWLFEKPKLNKNSWWGYKGCLKVFENGYSYANSERIFFCPCLIDLNFKFYKEFCSQKFLIRNCYVRLRYTVSNKQNIETNATYWSSIFRGYLLHLDTL